MARGSLLGHPSRTLSCRLDRLEDHALAASTALRSGELPSALPLSAKALAAAAARRREREGSAAASAAASSRDVRRKFRNSRLDANSAAAERERAGEGKVGEGSSAEAEEARAAADRLAVTLEAARARHERAMVQALASSRSRLLSAHLGRSRAISGDLG